jgi:hypothetical protein
VSETPDIKLRVVAYIDQLWGPERLRLVQKDAPIVPLGFMIDASVEIEGGSGSARCRGIVQHYGDGRLYPTLTEAKTQLAEETGIMTEDIPEESRPVLPAGRGGIRCAAFFICEFVPSNRPWQEVMAESSVGKRNPDLSSISGEYTSPIDDLLGTLDTSQPN